MEIELTGADLPVGGLVERLPSVTISTDADGKATFPITRDDPDTRSSSEDDYRTVVWVLTPGENAPAGTHAGYVVFAEEGSKVSSVSVAGVAGYAVAPSAGGSTANRVIVTVTDQYGKPMRGQPITLTSSANNDANSDDDFTDDGDTLGSVLPETKPRHILQWQGQHPLQPQGIDSLSRNNHRMVANRTRTADDRRG